MGGKRRTLAVCSRDRTPKVGFLLFPVSVRADDVEVDGTVEDDLGKSREGSRTDDEVVQRLVPVVLGKLLLKCYGFPLGLKGWFDHQ